MTDIRDITISIDKMLNLSLSLYLLMANLYHTVLHSDHLMSLVNKIVEAITLVNSLNYINLGEYADTDDETADYIVVQVSEDNYHLVAKNDNVTFVHLGECKGIQYVLVENSRVQYPIQIKPSVRYIPNGVMFNRVSCISFEDVPKYLLANYLQI